VNVIKGRCLGKGLSRIEMKKDKEIKRAVENQRGKMIDYEIKMRALRSLYYGLRYGRYGTRLALTQ